MWEIIAAAVLCVFALAGFVAFIKALIYLICKGKSENAYIVIKGNKGQSHDIEYTLRSLEAKAKWMGKAPFDSIIIVDYGLSEEQREICRLLCNESEMYKICSPDELCEIFS